MIAKIFLLSLSIPSTVVGSYYFTKHFDALKVFKEKSSYLIVKAQEPKTALHGSRAKSADKMNNNGKKNFRCVIHEKSNNAIYDNDCEIYKFTNSSNGSTPAKPQIIDISAINAASSSSEKLEHTDIKENNFYLLKFDPYKFKDINNFTEIQLVDFEEFPQQKEFANLRVEAVLNGGGNKSALENNTPIPLIFSDKFKSNLLLVKLTTTVSSFTWQHSLKCQIGTTITTCNAWELTTPPSANSELKNLSITQLDLVDGTAKSLTKDNYYILDIDSRQAEFDTKTSQEQKIQFSNHTQTPSEQNTFSVVSGLFGTITPESSNPNSSTLKQTDQLVFISSNQKVPF